MVKASPRYAKSGLLYTSIAATIAAIDLSNNLRARDFMASPKAARVYNSPRKALSRMERFSFLRWASVSSPAGPRAAGSGLLAPLAGGVRLLLRGLPSGQPHRSAPTTALLDRSLVQEHLAHGLVLPRAPAQPSPQGLVPGPSAELAQHLQKPVLLRFHGHRVLPLLCQRPGDPNNNGLAGGWLRRARPSGWLYVRNRGHPIPLRKGRGKIVLRGGSPWQRMPRGTAWRFLLELPGT